MTKRNAVLLFAVGLALTACGGDEAKHEDVRPVRTEITRLDSTSTVASFSGEIRARRESMLAFRLSGQITQRYVELGQTVKAGQALFKLDGRDVGLQQAAAKSQLDKARMDFERAQQLKAQGFVSQSNVDQYKAALDAAQSQYSLSANQGGYTVLTAEKAGVITAVNAEVGQVVAAGTPVAKLAEQGEREVLVSIPESRVDELRKADKLTVSTWAAPDRKFDAKLRELAPDTDPVTRTYAARIAIDSPDDSLRLGMTANVTLPNAEARAGISLPLTAIYDVDGQPKVWVVDVKTQRVSARPVQLAGTNNDRVLIASGIRAGETVVTAGAHLLHADQLVRIAASQLNRQ